MIDDEVPVFYNLYFCMDKSTKNDLVCDSKTTGLQLKEEAFKHSQLIPVANQKLMYMGKEIKDGDTAESVELNPRYPIFVIANDDHKALIFLSTSKIEEKRKKTQQDLFNTSPKDEKLARIFNLDTINGNTRNEVYKSFMTKSSVRAGAGTRTS